MISEQAQFVQLAGRILKLSPLKRKLWASFHGAVTKLALQRTRRGQIEALQNAGHFVYLSVVKNYPSLVLRDVIGLSTPDELCRAVKKLSEVSLDHYLGEGAAK